MIVGFLQQDDHAGSHQKHGEHVDRRQALAEEWHGGDGTYERCGGEESSFTDGTKRAQRVRVEYDTESVTRRPHEQSRDDQEGRLRTPIFFRNLAAHFTRPQRERSGIG